MNKQQFKQYYDQYTEGEVPITSPDFLTAWQMYQKGDREGYKRGLKKGHAGGYKKGYSHAVYLNPVEKGKV